MRKLPYARGGIVTAQEYNALVDAVNQFIGMRVGGGLTSRPTSGGLALMGNAGESSLLEVVTDVDYTSPNFTQTKQSICVVTSGEPEDTTWATSGPCPVP